MVKSTRLEQVLNKHTPLSSSSREVWPGTHLFSPDLLGELRRRHKQQRVSDGRELLPGQSRSPRGEEAKNDDEDLRDRLQQPYLSSFQPAQSHVSSAWEDGRSPAGRPQSEHFLAYSSRSFYIHPRDKLATVRSPLEMKRLLSKQNHDLILKGQNTPVLKSVFGIYSDFHLMLLNTISHYFPNSKEKNA